MLKPKPDAEEGGRNGYREMGIHHRVESWKSVAEVRIRDEKAGIAHGHGTLVDAQNTAASV